MCLFVFKNFYLFIHSYSFIGDHKQLTQQNNDYFRSKNMDRASLVRAKYLVDHCVPRYIITKLGTAGLSAVLSGL